MIEPDEKIQSSNPEYEKFRQAMLGNNPYEGLNKLTGEWICRDFSRFPVPR